MPYTKQQALHRARNVTILAIRKTCDACKKKIRDTQTTMCIILQHGMI